MKLKNQKRIAASVFKGSKKRVIFETSKLEQIKEAITRFDIRNLITQGVISEKPKRGVSRGRARKVNEQKRKGRRSGAGNKKGTRTARTPKKLVWMNKIRLQRSFLKELKEKKLVDDKIFRDLYRKAKGGFFRSKRHIKLYVNEHGLVRSDDDIKK
ncbi:50S ribosomal protein L19e [Candidatus Woesearchaeota archaeon]|nr:50S ribosomal protein L19e [Candidatus Woesearchaeota archaeon]